MCVCVFDRINRILSEVTEVTNFARKAVRTCRAEMQKNANDAKTF